MRGRSTQSVAYRLKAVGDDAIVNSHKKIGDAGEAAAKRTANAFNRDMRLAETAVERLERRAARLGLSQTQAQQRINDSVGLTVGGRDYKSAEASMRSFMRAQDELEKSRSRLLTQFDPLFAAQQRYNQAIAEATKLRKQGAISQAEFNSIQARATSELDNYSKAAGKGARGTNAFNFGVQNVGYQVSDFAVQVGGGTSAIRAFSQQSPQMIQALALMGHGAQDSESKFGKFATFITGPWGAALTVGVSILGALATQTLKSGEKFDAGKLSAEDFAKGLDTAKLSAQNTRAAMEQLVTVTRDLINVQNDYIEQSIRVANVEQENAERQLATIESKLRTLKQADNGILSLLPFYGRDENQLEIIKLEKDAAALRAARDDAFQSQSNAEIALQLRETNEIMDKGTRLQGEYNRELSELVRLRTLGATQGIGSAGFVPLDGVEQGISKSEFNRRERLLRERYERDKDLVQKQERALRTNKKLPAVTTSEVRNILSGIGGQITSGTRTKAQNDAVGGSASSYHLAGQAFDLGLYDRNGRRLTKAIITDALTAAGVKIKELLGPGDKGHDDHFHVAFAKNRLGTDARLDAQMKAEQALQKAREGNTKSVLGLLTAYDPLLKITEDYRAKIAEIARLEAAGPGNGGLTKEQADQLRKEAAGERLDSRAGAFKIGGFEGIERRAEEETRKQDYIDDILAEQEERNRFLALEESLIGASADERERQLDKLRFILDLERENVGLTDEEKQNFIAGNDALVRREQLLQEQLQLTDELNRVGEDMVDTIFDPQNWNDFGDLGKKIINDLIQDMIRLTLLNPLKNLLFDSGLPVIGSGGLFGGIFGNAVGTEYFSGGLTRLHENGTELVTLPRGSQVHTASESRRMMAQGGATTIIQKLNFDLNGAVVTQDLLNQMQQMSDQAAEKGADMGVERAVDLNARTFGAAFAGAR